MDYNRLLFVQFSDSMFKRHYECDRYWDAFYRRWESIGYYRGRYVFEIPKWICEITYFLPSCEKEVFYCENDIDEVISRIGSVGYDYVMMSLMNCNEDMIYKIIERCPYQKFIVGGYDKLFMDRMGRSLSNVSICSCVSDIAGILGVEYVFGCDYSLFSGERVIPRLTLSYGCLNRCRFCIVPHGEVIPVSDDVIFQQMDSFSCLDYRLVYIDDKTFGQCSNYVKLKELGKRCVNNDFNGFIVQTTSGMVIDKCKDFIDIGVKVVEIGLESYNDGILRRYRKPSSERMVRDCISVASDNGLKLIANIIIGLDGESEDTYKRTYDFVMPLLEEGKLIGINPAIYTDYSESSNLGEIDFKVGEGYELCHKWWDKFNSSAADVLNGQMVG